MRQILNILPLVVFFYLGSIYFGIDLPRIPRSAPHKTETVPVSRDLQSNPQSGSQYSGSGRVSRILADDNEGSRHQRFILTLSSNQTLLIAHNIDIAPRIQPLNIGDVISFNGVYESNPQGGVVHWTHRDPHGSHESGWLQKDGQIYQ